jgi:hypothetical protein
MKTFIGTILLGLMLLGCGSDEPSTRQPADGPHESMAADEKLYTEAASKLVSQFGQSLQSTLLNALNENGTAYAVRVCQIRAQELVAAHSTDTWSVKRVSDRWRNINDRPDTVGLAILKEFADPKTADDYLINWTGSDSAREFHYYKKIVMKPMCLQCHGDLQTVDLDLWKEIRIAYPYDKATGYKEGELRGMFVVTAKWPEGRDLAEALAAGADITTLNAVDSTAGDSATVDSTATEPAGDSDTSEESYEG